MRRNRRNRRKRRYSREVTPIGAFLCCKKNLDFDDTKKKKTQIKITQPL